MDLKEILNHAGMVVETRQWLFLRLCALNYLNALVKQKENRGVLDYGTIKSRAFFLINNIVGNNKIGLCDDLYIKPSEDCMYLRCYGLQFGFHHIRAKELQENFPQLCNEDVQWDGVRLQPLAEQLYELAKEVVVQDMDEQTVKDRIQPIINSKN